VGAAATNSGYNQRMIESPSVWGVGPHHRTDYQR